MSDSTNNPQAVTTGSVTDHFGFFAATPPGQCLFSVNTADNEPTFEPPALADPAFMAWAVRVGLCLANKLPGSPAGATERAILMEGTPSPGWAQGLAFMMRLAVATK